MQGIANRTDFDLSRHSQLSKKELAYFDEEAKTKVVPFVIEPSIGIGRLVFTILIDAFYQKEEKEEKKNVLRLKPLVAPVKFAIFPLMKRDKLPEKAREVFEKLFGLGVAVEYDESGSIGKRYARQDEIGTPFCITIDYDSLEKNDVTIRSRDSGEQERFKITKLVEKCRQLLC